MQVQLKFSNLHTSKSKLTMRFVFTFRSQCEGESNAVKLQMTANAIALMARSLSFDSEFMSPFSVNARRNNINATGKSNEIQSKMVHLEHSRVYVSVCTLQAHISEKNLCQSNTCTLPRARDSYFVCPTLLLIL